MNSGNETSNAASPRTPGCSDRMIALTLKGHESYNDEHPDSQFGDERGAVVQGQQVVQRDERRRRQNSPERGYGDEP